MSDRTAIEWTDASWNPLRGCSRVSAGCRNCYAERLAARFSKLGQAYEGLAKMTASGPRWTGEVRLVEEALTLPLRWKQPRRIFVNSMSDLFHERVPDAWIDQIVGIIAGAPRHTFQVLTKRAERMRGWFQSRVALGWNERPPIVYEDSGFPPRNLWLGVSVENADALWRVQDLIQTPAAVRFLSVEPLLGPVDLTRYGLMPPAAGGLSIQLRPADWVIVGGESGGPSGRRLVEPCEQKTWQDLGGGRHGMGDCPDCHGTAWKPKPWALEAVRSLRDQCQDAGVAFFFKAWGGPTPKSGGRLLDGREWSEFPR